MADTTSKEVETKGGEYTPKRPESQLGIEITGSPEDGQNIRMTGKDALERIFGTKHPEMVEGLVSHCLKVLKSTEASDDYEANDERMFMFAAIAEIEPRDGIERLLAVQMAATHVAMVRSGRWLASADRVDQVNAHYSGYTKLARAYTAQMEALRKHRSGGKQTVTVQHVNVEDGGQAIVGNVETGGRVTDGK